MKTQNIDYFFELYERGVVPEPFSKVTFTNNSKVYSNPDYNESKVEASKKIYSVFFISDYLKPDFNKDIFSAKKVTQFFKGYAIFLNGFDTADAYVKHRFRSNAKGIRRRIKRLESCFSISYKTFYGEIKREEYDVLMECLRKMLVRRFEQRNDISQSLTQWNRYLEMYFSLINDKKASMFVVFDNDTPIVVSLNHHFQGKLFSAISSYDIDYAKFSLGSVEIYKKLEWCLDNNHDSYEMGMGDLSYKREWCNHIYNFEHHIIYPQKYVLASLKAFVAHKKISLKEFVFKVAYVRYKKFKASRKKSNDFEVEFNASKIEEITENPAYAQVDYNTEEYSFLRKPTFDFLYSAIEHESNVHVFEESKQNKTYLIVGKTKMQKVTF